jgi:hypothetical protein
MQVADCGRQILGIALLEAQSINLEIAGQIDQLSTGYVLAEVVADDSNQEGTPSDDSCGRCDRVYPVRPAERWLLTREPPIKGPKASVIADGPHPDF